MLNDEEPTEESPEGREPFWYDDSGPETTFVENMKMLRERRGMSQTELAKRASDRGLAFHQPTIQRIERGERPIKLGEAIKLASILGSTLETMMKDASLSFSYEVLVSQIRDLWQAIQPDDGTTFPRAATFHWNVNELRDSIQDYRAAVARFDEDPQPDILEIAESLLAAIEEGLAYIDEGQRRAAERWTTVVDPMAKLPETFHSATPYAEMHGPLAARE